MAIAPIRIQQPAVPLIGGQQLPKASGEGVRAPDISNSFSEFTAALYAQQGEADAEKKRGKALDDQAQALVDAEIYHDATVGKNPLDRYTNPPKINGTPTYRAAAQNAIEADAVSDIRTIYAQQAGAIQVELDTPTDQKLLRMHSAFDAIVETIAPQYRAAARQYFNADIVQREAQLRGEDTLKLENAIEAGQKARLNEAFDKGVSAASAGADWTQHTADMRAVIDERVKMGKMLPEDGEREKARLTNLVVAEGVHRTISTEAMKGNISAAELLEMGVAMESGAPFDLYADRIYQPGFEGDRFDTGQTKTDPSRKKIISADNYKQLIGDPATTKAIAQDMQELARHLAAGAKAQEKDLQLWQFLEESEAFPARSLPEALRTTFNEKVDMALRSPRNALDSPEGQAYLKMLTRASNYMAPELLNQLKGRMQGTFEQAMQALNLYNELTTTVNGTVQAGKIILQSVPSDDAALFDSAITFAADILRQNPDNEKAMEQQWRAGMLKLADKANSMDFFAEDFRAKTKAAGAEQSLESAINERFLSHYERQRMDPNFMREAKAAYRNSMILSGDVDQVVALDKVMERMFNRYTASPIFTNGIAPTEKWENPDIDGYRPGQVESATAGMLTWGKPIDPDLWTNDFVTDQLHKRVDSGQVVMSAEGAKALNDALAAGADGIPLGRLIFLEPVAGDRARTQFIVRVAVEQGASMETVMVTGPDGRPTALLLDPGLILSNINTRNHAGEEIEKTEAAYVDQRNRDIIRQRTKTAEPGTPSPYALIHDPATFEKWFANQDSDFQKYFIDNDMSHQQVLKKQQQRYMDLEKTLVPEGMKVDPKLLGQNKAVGKGIVLGAVETIGKVFGDDTNTMQFMINVAAAESGFGSAEDTFRASGDRGLWQVNDTGTGAFMEIKRRAAIPGDPLAVAAARAKAALGIDVAALVPSDLDKPLVSALMARMYFMRTQEPIPSDPEAQAAFWRDNYNPRATDDMVANFVSAANTLLVTPAYASTGGAATRGMRTLDVNGPGLVTDVGGNAYPANFLATNPSTQTSALRLSAAFGQPLQITPHGGTQADARKHTSQHHRGTAIDIYVANMSDADKTRLIAIAISMGYRGFGGYGAGDGVGTIHLDLRNSGKHGGLALWWRKRPGKDGPWSGGEKWFVDGITQGAAMRGINLG